MRTAPPSTRTPDGRPLSTRTVTSSSDGRPISIPWSIDEAPAPVRDAARHRAVEREVDGERPRRRARRGILGHARAGREKACAEARPAGGLVEREEEEAEDVELLLEKAEDARVRERRGNGLDRTERGHQEAVARPDGLWREVGVERVERDAERGRELPLHVVARDGRVPLRAALLHPHAPHAAVRPLELERERAETHFDRDSRRAVRRLVSDPSERRHHDGRADRRVAGVRNLLDGHERALEIRVLRVGGRQDERGLGVIDLARDGLHLGGRHSARIGHDEKRIPRERPVREDVAGDERDSHGRDTTARRHVRKRQRPTIGSARSRAPRRGYGLAEKKRSSTRNPAASTSATTRCAGLTAM